MSIPVAAAAASAAVSLLAGCSAGSGIQDIPSAAPPTTAPPTTATSTERTPTGPTSTAGGQSAPPPSSTPASIVYGAATAVGIEIALKERDTGCWSEAQPGNRFGAYRQDYYYPPGRPCRGGSWALDVEVFNQAAPTAAAVRATPPGSVLYRAANALLVVNAAAPAGLRRVVPTLPGVEPVNR